MKKITLLIVTPALIVFVNPVQAELSTLIQAEYAEKTLSHEFKTKGLPGSSELSGDTSSAVFGFTVSGQSVYANLTAEFPLRNYSDYQLAPEVNYVTLSRRDHSFTLGYNIMKHLSLFTGYKYGRTTADSTTYNGTQFDYFNTIFLKEYGTFIGASTSFNINDKNIISASAAYADMTAEFINKIDPVGIGGYGPGNSKGDADGYSLSLKWLHQMTDTTLISLGYKYNNYDSEMDMPDGGVMLGSSEYNYYSIGLTHFF